MAALRVNIGDAKKQETFKSRMDEALDAAEEAVAHAKEMEEELPEESED